MQTYRFSIMGNYVAVSDSIINPFVKNQTTTRMTKLWKISRVLAFFFFAVAMGSKKLFASCLQKMVNTFQKIRDFPESTQQEAVQNVET